MPITMRDIDEYYKLVHADPSITATELITKLMLRALPPQAVSVYDIVNDCGDVVSATVVEKTGLSQTEAARHLKLLSEKGLVVRSIDESKTGKGPVRFTYSRKENEQ